MDQSFDPQWLRQLDTTDNERIRDWATGTSKTLQRPPPVYLSSKYDSLSTAIEDDIDLIEEAIYRIARNRAIMSRARWLPFDILVIIFQFLGPFQFPEREDVVQLLNLASVCGRWRQCILSTPSFWSYIVVGEYHCTNRIWGMVETWQQRAGTSCPLHITTSNDIPVPTECQEFLKSNAKRIVSLQILTQPFPDSTHLFTEELLVAAAESIVELAFQGGATPRLSHGFKVTLPKVKYLDSFSIFPNLDIQTPSLREIAVHPGPHSHRYRLPRLFLDILSRISTEVTSIRLQGVEVDLVPLIPAADFTLPHLTTLQWVDVTNDSRHEIPLYIISHSNCLTTLHIGLSFLAESLPRCQSLTTLTLANENVSDSGYSPTFVSFDREQVSANFGNIPSLKLLQMPIFNHNCLLLQKLAQFVMQLFSKGTMQKHCQSLEEFRCDCEPHLSRDKTVKVKDDGLTLLGAVGAAIITKSDKRKKGQPVVTFKHASFQSPWDEITQQTLSLAQFKVVYKQLSDEKGGRPFYVQFSK